MSNNQTTSLEALLPSTPYLLSYALPLLLLSLLLTFAGAFLTLDRTRSFPPSWDASIPGPFHQRRNAIKIKFVLEGGVGGMAIGFTFGLHLASFLSLLIPNVSVSAPLTSKSFLVVWILSSLTVTILAARWKYVALLLSGVSGGATLALSISIMVHPPLTSRIVLAAVLLPILTIASMLPLKRVQHAALRISACTTGAFGVVLAIALLSHTNAWAECWERLWVSNRIEWGTSKEKGLSAAFCILLCVGIACDWALKFRFGENPDQKWDHYLANYSANLPNRAGTFQPLSSIWSRLFGKHERHTTLTDAILFPAEEDLKSHIPSSQKFLHKESKDVEQGFEARPTFLRKGRSQTEVRLKALGRQKRERVKFRPLDSIDSSDSDSGDEGLATPLTPPAAEKYDVARPWLKQQEYLSSSSTASVEYDGGTVAYEREKINLAKVKASLRRDEKNSHGSDNEGQIPDYSDFEEDIAVDGNRRKVSRGESGWSPGFLQRHKSVNAASSTTSQRTAVNQSSRPISPLSPDATSVPATPSLIKALDRVAKAQHTAFAQPLNPTGERATVRPGLPPSKSSEAGPVSTEGLPQRRVRETKEGFKGARWEEFWRDVKHKAAQQK